jgi:hypothetical protein
LKLVATLVLAAAIVPTALAFEGRIEAAITQGSETTPLLYTVGTNVLRIEVTGTSLPNPIDIVDLKSDAMTLVFPHNRSFVRLKTVATDAVRGPQKGNEPSSAPKAIGAATTPPDAPAMPMPPPGVGPQSPPNPAAAGPPGVPPMPAPPGGLPPGIGPQFRQGGTGPSAPTVTSMPTIPGAEMPAILAMPPMPMMLPMTGGKIELKPTGKKERILGFASEQYELKQRGETLEVWATSQLFPYQPYLRNQPSRFGPRMIEEQWGELLTAKKLFPLRASLHYDNGAERFHFEVKSVTPQKIDNKDGKLFQPPEGYFEIQPLPF